MINVLEEIVRNQHIDPSLQDNVDCVLNDLEGLDCPNGSVQH